MNINVTLVKEFKRLYRKKYGEEIDFDTASKGLRELAELIRIVQRQVKKHE